MYREWKKIDYGGLRKTWTKNIKRAISVTKLEDEWCQNGKG